MFDLNMFMKIVLWGGAVIGTLIFLLVLVVWWYHHFTAIGKLKLVMMQYTEHTTIVLKWKWFWLAVICWTALACYR